MDADTLYQRTAAGYGKAARVLGRRCTVYGAVGTGAVIVDTNIRGHVMAAFDTSPKFTFVNPQKFGNPIYYAACDSRTLNVGDYLAAPDFLYFIATVDDVASPMVVRCNHALTFTRKGAGTPGVNAYGGDQSSATLLTARPASVLQGTKGEKGDANLPRDARVPWVQILMPAVDGVQLRFGDMVQDEQAQPMRYLVSSVEQTGLGWRITATVVVV